MKKPVKKKSKGGKLLGMLSPAVSLAQSIKSGQPEGLLSMSPLAMMAGRRKKDEEGRGPSGPSTPTRMKAGGKVTRGDGVCTKGHTKGKMV